MKQVSRILVIRTLLTYATPVEASFLQKLSRFAYKATKYITTCWQGPLKRTLSQNDLVFFLIASTTIKILLNSNEHILMKLKNITIPIERY